MVLFRRLLGDVLRERRGELGLTLRDVSKEARVSLGYISEIERGQKEASSELLASLCGALDMPLSSVLREVSVAVAVEEATLEPTPITSQPGPPPTRSSPPPPDLRLAMGATIGRPTPCRARSSPTPACAAPCSSGPTCPARCARLEIAHAEIDSPWLDEAAPPVNGRRGARRAELNLPPPAPLRWWCRSGDRFARCAGTRSARVRSACRRW